MRESQMSPSEKMRESLDEEFLLYLFDIWIVANIRAVEFDF